jgi:hypothetical protein
MWTSAQRDDGVENLLDDSMRRSGRMHMQEIVDLLEIVRHRG